MSENINYVQYSTIGGTDIHAMFGNFKFGSLQMVRYAVNREKAPVFTLGSPSARATARGKRHVNGALVFSLIDRDGLVKAMAKAGNDQKVFLSHDEMANFAGRENLAIPEKEDPRLVQALLAGGTVGVSGILPRGQAYSPFAAKSVFKPSNFGSAQTPFIADQLLPFDITLIGVPEYGSVHAKRMIIRGVEITTEASGTSIDDITIEKQLAFIARSVDDWVPLSDLTEAVGTTNQNTRTDDGWSNTAANRTTGVNQSSIVIPGSNTNRGIASGTTP